MERIRTRYYAEWTETDTFGFRSTKTGWQVFDRDLTDRSGRVRAICLCASRSTAFRIRDTLNAMEFQMKEGNV